MKTVAVILLALAFVGNAQAAPPPDKLECYRVYKAPPKLPNPYEDLGIYGGTENPIFYQFVKCLRGQTLRGWHLV